MDPEAFDGKFKVSGIKYDLNKTEFWTDNFKEKLITIKKNFWSIGHYEIFHYQGR
jgi:hypothetical protein